MLTELFSKQEKRAILFIDKIIEKPYMISLEQLCKSADCSEQTVINDFLFIQNINESFKYSLNNDTLLFEEETYNSLLDIKNQIIIQSNINKILNSVINDIYENSNELSQAVGVSPSTISRVFKGINKFLVDYYGIEIIFNPFGFSGPENKIRSFIQEYFLEMNYLSGWSFDCFGPDRYHNYINEFTNILEQFPDFSNIREITQHCIVSQLCTNLSRFKIDKKITNQAFKTLPQEMSNQLIQLVESYTSLKITAKDLGNIFYPYLNHNFIYKINDSISNPRIHDTIHLILDRITSQVPIAFNNKDEVFIALANMMYHMDHNSPSPSILYNYKSLKPKTCAQFFPAFFHIIQNSFQNVPHLEDPYKIETLISILFSTWENLYPELSDYYFPIRILLIPEFTYYHSLWIKNIVELEIPQKIQIDIYKEAKIITPMTDFSDYDIILKQVHYPTINHPRIINFGSYFDNINYIQLLTMIETIVENRTKSISWKEVK